MENIPALPVLDKTAGLQQVRTIADRLKRNNLSYQTYHRQGFKKKGRNPLRIVGIPPVPERVAMKKRLDDLFYRRELAQIERTL